MPARAQRHVRLLRPSEAFQAAAPRALALGSISFQVTVPGHRRAEYEFHARTLDHLDEHTLHLTPAVRDRGSSRIQLLGASASPVRGREGPPGLLTLASSAHQAPWSIRAPRGPTSVLVKGLPFGQCRARFESAPFKFTDPPSSQDARIVDAGPTPAVVDIHLGLGREGRNQVLEVDGTEYTGQAMIEVSQPRDAERRILTGFQGFARAPCILDCPPTANCEVGLADANGIVPAGCVRVPLTIQAGETATGLRRRAP